MTAAWYYCKVNGVKEVERKGQTVIDGQSRILITDQTPPSADDCYYSPLTIESE